MIAKITTTCINVLVLILYYSSGINAQNQILVWEDTFEETSLDRSIWSFETGPQGDCLHYSTDRTENTTVVNGELHLIASKESYQGYNYTASIIKTTRAVYWQYGLIEARIKLPGTTGFVPAFWLLAENNLYGWWPQSGEIDILEHPTNQPDRIFGTVHTGTYNYFTGTAPVGSSIQIPDAETEFHVYAIEWTPDKIDFYVDEQKYFTFENEHTGFMAWPFDQPFYILLGMGVGGGWVGDPDETTVFPATMQVDWVRAYQNFNDISVYGEDFVVPGSKGIGYHTPVIEETQYSWNVPDQASIASGQNTSQILVDWGSMSGNIELQVTSGDDDNFIEYPVEVMNSLIKNGSFEKGVKYWRKTGSYPAEADFILTDSDVHSGNYALYVDVTTPGTNPWDAQLSQGDITLEAGIDYQISFWAKSLTNGQINAAVINSTNYTVYGIETIELTNTWTYYEFGFTTPANVMASFNIDMGGHTGKYLFDDLKLIPPENYLGLDEEERVSLDISSIYPNPAYDKVNIYLPESMPDITVEIFDILGKKMFTRCTGNHQIDVSGYPPGVYYLRIAADNRYITRKVFKR